MSRDEVHFRDRLLFLSECSNPHKPFNVKRKSTLTKQSSKTTSKLSMQDFVRMDPGYTPDIEHLVFPMRKRNPQQVAPLNTTTGKTRSRLAEMFALSRHLQQRSTDREAKGRNAVVNRSIDSAMEPPRQSAGAVPTAPPSGTRTSNSTRRWAVEEPVRQNFSTRISPAAESEMSTARGPNVSVLHLRGISDPWEPHPTYPVTKIHSRPNPPLTKHQSLGGNPFKWTTSSNFRSTTTTPPTLNRELSPVRWCDREVDGVYLGRSGWVQVQQRSLDENRRTAYATTTSMQQSKKIGIKLADYHCKSEPSRPAFLSLPKEQEKEMGDEVTESFSPPPPITPIISPPPAFQDRNKKGALLKTTRTFFGKTPFLPRSNAIDSDEISPPLSPKPLKWKSASMPSQTRIKTNPLVIPPEIKKPIPQTKSLEDTTAARRNLFVKHHGESSSSSSSSMGFRSLDSCVSRPVMPRLSENTDSSVDVYEDADEEDNNSSSINISIPPVSILIPKEKISPSSRPNRYRPNRKSPASSEGGKTPTCASPGSSSSSSNGFPPTRSPMGSQQQLRRTPPRTIYPPKTIPLDDPALQRVRRSRSLQLPDRNMGYGPQLRISPQKPPKMGTQVPPKRYNLLDTTFTEADVRREAEIVSNFIYSSRTKAAAQALLMQRYQNVKEEKPPQPPPKPPYNGYSVYYVGPKPLHPKTLHRGSTTPNLPLPKTYSEPAPLPPPPLPSRNPCNKDTCDFWPHCAHRESIIMRSSQSYPTHQRSLDSGNKLGYEGSVKKVSPNGVFVSSSSSSSDIWLTTSDRTVMSGRSPPPKGGKTSGGSTPLEELTGLGEVKREMILTRPGSAPAEERNDGNVVETEKRSMSLPKSFLSVSHPQG